MESLSRFPLWLEYSGLPLELARRCKTPLAWLVFRKVVELDVALNSTPGMVEMALGDFAPRIGMEADALRKAIGRLRRCGVLRCFLPETDAEECLFQVVVPIPTPVTAAEVLAAHPELAAGIEQLRYAAVAADLAGGKDFDRKLKQVIDLYLDRIGMKLNAFILDDLRLIAHRHDLDAIRKVFARASKAEGRGLAWVASQIRREEKQGVSPAKSATHHRGTERGFG